MKYKDWLRVWYENYIKPAAKTRTAEKYREIISNRLIPNFGEYKTEEISPLEMQKYITNLSVCGNLVTGKGLSSNSINGIITVAQASLKAAYEAGVCLKCIANKIKRPKTYEKKIECFSLREQQTIEQCVLNSGKTKDLGIIICLYTGLRLGELLALSWKDVNFQERIIIVSKTCHDCKGGKRNFGTPKTKSSCREIPIPRKLLTILSEMKKEGCEFVIHKNGRPMGVRTYQKYFESLQKRLNIKRRGFHSLRHTFATRALECGMDVKTLSEILGHKNSAVTLNRYAHSLTEHKAAMMNKLGNLLLEKSRFRQ